MKFLFAFLLVGWFGMQSAAAQPSVEIENVISQQLEAFKKRDVAKAFEFASPLIKRVFRNSDNFGMMVARGYPMVWDSSEVRFLELRDLGAIQMQKVLMLGPDGVPHVIEYKLIETSRGWEIDGVELLAPPEVGA